MIALSKCEKLVEPYRLCASSQLTAKQLEIVLAPQVYRDQVVGAGR